MTTPIVKRKRPQVAPSALVTTIDNEYEKGYKLYVEDYDERKIKADANRKFMKYVCDNALEKQPENDLARTIQFYGACGFSYSIDSEDKLTLEEWTRQKKAKEERIANNSKRYMKLLEEKEKKLEKRLSEPIVNPNEKETISDIPSKKPELIWIIKNIGLKGYSTKKVSELQDMIKEYNDNIIKNKKSYEEYMTKAIQSELNQVKAYKVIMDMTESRIETILNYLLDIHTKQKQYTDSIRATIPRRGSKEEVEKYSTIIKELNNKTQKFNDTYSVIIYMIKDAIVFKKTNIYKHLERNLEYDSGCGLLYPIEYYLAEVESKKE
jgi:hypothetical protein